MKETLQSTVNRYNQETHQKSMGCANIMTFVSVKKGDYILDLGCGRGYQTKMLADLTGDFGKAFGVDITPAMIKKASEEYGQSNLEFMIGDIHQLPIASDSIDLVTSNCVINHSTCKEKVYSEIFRTLKPGGRFIIADIMAVEELPEEVKNDPEAIAACYGGAIVKEEYINKIEKIGFKNIKELTSRTYPKNGFLLESIILTGEKE